MPISPPVNPRLGQVYKEAGTTYVWIGATWVETIPSTSPPFPSINELSLFSIGPTGPAGLIGTTGPSGGPIGPTGYTGTTGPLPNFSVEFGPNNGLIGTINYDVNAGVNDTSLGGMWTTNNSTNFMNAFGRLSIGDTYTAKLDYPNGNSTIKSLTLASIPVGTSSYWQWSTYENDHDLIGDYGLIYLNSLQGKPGPTGPVGVGLANGGNSIISSNLIPATGNVYSIGDSTHWWKDVWISANTFYVGGKPISVTANGQISIGDLVVTGSINGAAVNNVFNPVSGEPLITYNYTFDATLTDWNVYSGNRSVPDGKFIILGVGWPERPGVSLFGSNGTSGGYVNYMKMSGKTSDGTDIYQELKDKFAAAQYPNPSYTFIRLTEAGNPGNYSVFYWGGSLTSHDNSKTFEFAVTYISGTASSSVWTSSNTQIIVEFSQKTMHGRIPLMDAQKYWWTKPHAFGPGFDMEVPYCAPLCCSGLWLYPPASNTGTVNFPTGNVWIGKSVTVWVFGNSLAKSNLVNVRTTSLPTTITANSFFNITYLDNNLKWAVTYQGNV